VTIWRRAAKRDTSEPAIVAALEKAGAKVWRLALPLDLLVGYHGRFLLLEVKSNARKPDKRQKVQTATIAACQSGGLPVYLVRTPEDALQAVGAVH
jgi:hypothetical protein